MLVLEERCSMDSNAEWKEVSLLGDDASFDEVILLGISLDALGVFGFHVLGTELQRLPVPQGSPL
jgi:hypothetical protein